MNPNPSGGAPALRSRFVLDLRSLALLRAGLAAFLLIDALGRLFDAGLLHGDGGLLPREAAVTLSGAAHWSLHLANGSTLFAVLLGALQVVAASALLIGWRSRLASVLLWGLLVSAAARNPGVLGAADALAAVMLSVGLFLPWNARWGVDAALDPVRAESPSHVSAAGIVLLLQALLLPLLLALLPGAGFTDGVTFVPAIFDTVLHVGALLVLPLALLPLFVEIPRRIALGLLLLLCGVALATCSLGTLPWLGLTLAALLIDAALWDRLAGGSSGSDLRVYYPDTSPRARRVALLLREFLCLPRTDVLAAQESPRVSRLINDARLVVIDRGEEAHLDADAVAVLLRCSPLLRPLRKLLRGNIAPAMGRRVLNCAKPGAVRTGRGIVGPALGSGLLAQRAVIGLGVLVLLVQFSAAGLLPRALGSALRLPLMPLGLDHSWPDALATNADGAQWIVIPGDHSDGHAVDARSADLDAPRFGRDQHSWLGGERGKQYERFLARADADGNVARLALARHLCRERGAALASLRIVLVVQESSSATAEQRVLLRHDCTPAAP